MRLTVYTDFSLRVLMYLALYPQRRPTVAEIARRYGISKNHVMKAAHQLGRAGYLESVRGQNGGVRLARPAQDIGLGEIVRRTEPDMATLPCFEPTNAACVLLPACKLRQALHEARDAFLAVLDGYSLADLVDNRDAIATLLSAGPDAAGGAAGSGEGGSA